MGSHQSLLSTYAIESMILFIINLLHLHTATPLCVLATFLDFYSQFDFSNYAMSLNGPVPLEQFGVFLPAVDIPAAATATHVDMINGQSEDSTSVVGRPTIEKQFSGCGKLLLPKAFVASCCEKYVREHNGGQKPSQNGDRSVENAHRKFVSKFFNIVDPLDPTNNLGRSVNYSNYCRILKALRKGALEFNKVH